MTAITIPINMALIVWAICAGFVIFEFGFCMGLWFALSEKKEICRLLLWELSEVKKMKFSKDEESDE